MSRKVLFSGCKVLTVPHTRLFHPVSGPVVSRLPLIFSNPTSNMSTDRNHPQAKDYSQAQSKSSVDNKQVEHLSSYADNWWNTQGLFMPLHTMNSLRIPLIRDGLIATKRVDPSYAETASPLKGTKILEVGCGGGILCEPLARLGAEVTGIDASKELIAVAKTHAEMDSRLKDNLKYLNITAEEHVLDHKEYYDAVIASEVVEHVYEKSFFVKKCVELTQPGGSIFMTTLTKTNMSWLGGIIAAEYILKLIPKGTHDWDLFITPEDLQKLLEKYSCYTKLIHGMMFFPVINKWYWTPNVCMNYAIHAVKSKV